jgi:hypothetical protein
MATRIHGIGASENIDSSGEVVSIAGLDISSLEKDGVFTYEHEQGKAPNKDGQVIEITIKIPTQVIGKILKAHKIFSEKDCEDKHQLHFWNKIKTPYLYVMGELFDDYTEAAKDIAGKFRYDADKADQNERKVMNFSVEGSKLPNSKEGMVVTRSIARKVTLTGFPCNKAAIAEMLPQGKKEEDDISSIFKSEQDGIEIFKFENGYAEFMEKSEELSKGEAPRWSAGSTSKDGTAVHFSHPEHDVVSIHKSPKGDFHVKHRGALAGHGGQKGVFSTAEEAGKHAKTYMAAISSGKTLAQKMHDRPSPQMPKMSKALDAGSALTAPSQLTGGAALAKEGVNKKMKKTTWLARAEQEYQTWGKKEEFEAFMKKRLPHLTKAEVKAIGQTLALQKSLKLEKALSRINPAYQEEETEHSSVRKEEELEKSWKHAVAGGLALLGAANQSHAASGHLHQLVEHVSSLPGVEGKSVFTPASKGSADGQGKYHLKVGKHTIHGEHSSVGGNTKFHSHLEGPHNPTGQDAEDYKKAKFLKDKIDTTGQKLLEKSELPTEQNECNEPTKTDKLGKGALKTAGLDYPKNSS